MKYSKLLLRELHLQGFKRVYEYRSRRITEAMVTYQKQVGNRLLDLQLWADGGHRVSHYLKGHMSTQPTTFRTLFEMKVAIKTELTRKDHLEAGRK